MTDTTASGNPPRLNKADQGSAETRTASDDGRTKEYDERMQRLIRKARREGRAGLVTDGVVYVIVEM